MMRKQKGFTLTEVIIAVAILSIAATPLISNFVTSAKINQKARNNLSAMNMAQDIMEGMSAYKAEQVVSMFESGKSLKGTIIPSKLKNREDPSDDDKIIAAPYLRHGDMDSAGTHSYSVNFQVEEDDLPEPGTGIETAESSKLYLAKKYDDTGIKVVRFDKSEKKTIMTNPSDGGDPTPDYKEGHFYFFIDGLKQQQNEYDVTVDMSYKESKDNDASRLFTVNSSIDPSYYNVDVFSGGSLTGGGFYEALQKFKSNATSVTLDDAMLTGFIEHKIKCEIKNAATDGTTNYQVLITDVYTITSSRRSALGLTDPVAYTYTRKGNENIFDNGATEAPRNIYITYTATPTVGGGPSQLDSFEFVNTTGQPVTIYLTRQKRYSGDSLNSNYKSSIEVKSYRDEAMTRRTDRTESGAEYGTDEKDRTNDDLKVVYNLRYNLNYEYLENLRYVDNKGNTVTGNDKKVLDMKRGWIEGDAPLDNTTMYDYNMCDLIYNGDVVTPNWEEKKYVQYFSDGLPFEESPATYDVKITVKDHDSQKVLAEYSGGLAGGTK